MAEEEEEGGWKEEKEEKKLGNKILAISRKKLVSFSAATG